MRQSSVDSRIRERVSEAVGDDPAGRIRLDSAAVPATAEEVHSIGSVGRVPTSETTSTQ